jgi:Holliday junction DNA helicase RuvA
MIGYLEGCILKKEEDRILLLVNHIGYEVLLPTMVMESLSERKEGDEVALRIFFHQTERQPKPVLIGFTSEQEKEFFQLFISVEDIGPMKAAKALNRPVREIARAIESKDLAQLTLLKGIGQRTANKIVASLHGKMEKFLAGRSEEQKSTPIDDLVRQVLDVLVTQLGHKNFEAKRMIEEAMDRNRSISSAEELFEEVYRGKSIA